MSISDRVLSIRHSNGVSSVHALGLPDESEPSDTLFLLSMLEMMTNAFASGERQCGEMHSDMTLRIHNQDARIAELEAQCVAAEEPKSSGIVVMGPARFSTDGGKTWEDALPSRDVLEARIADLERRLFDTHRLVFYFRESITGKGSPPEAETWAGVRSNSPLSQNPHEQLAALTAAAKAVSRADRRGGDAILSLCICDMEHVLDAQAVAK